MNKLVRVVVLLLLLVGATAAGTLYLVSSLNGHGVTPVPVIETGATSAPLPPTPAPEVIVYRDGRVSGLDQKVQDGYFAVTAVYTAQGPITRDEVHKFLGVPYDNSSRTYNIDSLVAVGVDMSKITRVVTRLKDGTQGITVQVPPSEIKFIDPTKASGFVSSSDWNAFDFITAFAPPLRIARDAAKTGNNALTNMVLNDADRLAWNAVCQSQGTAHAAEVFAHNLYAQLRQEGFTEVVITPLNESLIGACPILLPGTQTPLP